MKKLMNCKTAILLLVVVVCFVGNATAKKKRELKFTEKVKYIITHEEKLEFKSLETEEARQEFIEKFWDKRGAEFKARFEKRFEEANRKFRGEGKKGWLTDRGRIYILLGKPDQVDTETGGGEGFSGVGSRTYSTEYWTYYSLPASYKMPPHTTFEFVEDINGRFRQRGSVDLTINFSIQGLGNLNTVPTAATASVDRAEGLDLMGTQQIEDEAVNRNDAEMNLLAQLREKNDSEVKNILYSEELEEDVDFIRETYFLKTTNPDKVNVIISVGIMSSAVADEAGNYDLSVYAMARRDKTDAEKQLTGEDEAEKNYEYILPSFYDYEGNDVSDSEGFLLYQNSFLLESGDWTIKVAVKDNLTGKIGVQEEIQTVPDFKIMPGMSTVIIADKREIDKELSGENETGFVPFHIKENLVVPNIDHKCVKNIDDLVFYFQVYNEDILSETRAKLRPYDIKTVLFYRKTETQEFKKLGKDVVTLAKSANVEGFTLPANLLARYPAGYYEFRVTINDSKDKDKTANGKVSFRLVE